MRRIMLSAALAVATLASSLAWAGEAELYEAAKKEGTVVWYTSQVQNVLVHPLAAAFEAKYPGIKVSIVGGKNADLLLRILTEAKAGVHLADVNSPASIGRLSEAGLLAPYAPDAAKGYPAELRGKDGTWTAMLKSTFGVTINTDLVGPKDEPKSLEDYLDPKWKGKMAWVAHYDLGGGPGFIEAVLALMGEEKGMAYLRKLARQDIVKVPANQRVILDQVVAEQYPLALMMFQHHTAASVAKGAPLKWLGAGPFLTVTAPIALLQNAPHPNAGKLFTEFVLSEQGQSIVAGAGYPPARPGLKVKGQGEEAAAPAGLQIPPEQAEAILDAGIKLYKDIFR